MDRNDQDRMDADRSMRDSQQRGSQDRGMQGSPSQGGYGDDAGRSMDAARSGTDGGNRSDDRVGTTSNQTGSNRPSDESGMQGRPAVGTGLEEGLGNHDGTGRGSSQPALNERLKDQV